MPISSFSGGGQPRHGSASGSSCGGVDRDVSIGAGGRSMTDVLVTGAAGFVGINVTRALAARGHQVVAFDHRAPDGAARAYAGAKVRWVRGDVRDALRQAVMDHGIEVVAHA